MPLVTLPDCDVNAVVKIIARTPKGDSVTTVSGNQKSVDVPDKDFDPANEVVIEVFDHLGNRDPRHNPLVLQERANGPDPETKKDADPAVTDVTATDGPVTDTTNGPDGIGDTTADDPGLLAERQPEPVQSDQADVQAKPEVLTPCEACGQVASGQSGEYPCPTCGLPTLHDGEVLDQSPSTPDGEWLAKAKTAAEANTLPEHMTSGEWAAEYAAPSGHHLRMSDEVRETVTPTPPAAPDRLHVKNVMKRGKNKH